MHFLDGRFPRRHVSFPALHLPRHLRLDDPNHAVEDGMHVVTGEMGVAQIGPPVDVGRPEGVVVHEGVEDGDVSLTAHIAHVLRIARIRCRPSVGNAGVIRPVAERVVQIPKGIAPAATVSIGIPSPPPRRVPVEPIGTDHVAVQDEVVDERHFIEFAHGLGVVGLHRHVVGGDEIDEVVPIVPIAVFLPGTTPRLQEVDVVPRLIVVLLGEVAVIHLLAVFIHAPVLAVDVHDAALARALVQMKVGQLAQGLAVGVPNVRPTGVWIVVVGGRLEDQPLEFASVCEMKQLSIDDVIVSHLVAGDVVEPLLRVGIRVVSVLIGVPFGFHPKCTVLMEELDVHRLIPNPSAILQSCATHAHDTNGVAVVSEEIGVGLHETGRQNSGGVHHNGANHGGLHEADGRHVRQGRVRRLVAVERVVDVHARGTGNVQ